jgi:hypothetical protein
MGVNWGTAFDVAVFRIVLCEREPAQIPGECRNSLENVRLRGCSDTIQYQNWNRASN